MKSPSCFALCAGALSLALSPSLAHAEDFGAGFRAPQLTVSAGVRGTVLPSRGFDPYATNDLLLQSSFGLGVELFRAKNVSLAAGFEWDAGGKSATTRGQELRLFVHRLAIPLEARWQLHKRVALFAHVAPGANRMLASSDPELLARNWSFGVDTSVGTAVMIGKVKKARFWITGEIGYSFAFAAAMSLKHQQSEDETPRNEASTALPDLSVGGGLGRLGVAVSF
jgi:hypothetical protein